MKRRKTQEKEVNFNVNEEAEENVEEKPLANLEKRAAFYARADPKSLPSSTPTGSYLLYLYAIVVPCNVDIYL